MTCREPQGRASGTAFLTSADVARRLACTPKWVVELAKQGQIPGAYKFGRRYRFTEAGVAAFMQGLPPVAEPRDLRSVSLQRSARRGTAESRRARHLKEIMP